MEAEHASNAVPPGAPGDLTEDSGRVRGGFGEDSWSNQGVVLSQSLVSTLVMLVCSRDVTELAVLD